MVLLLLVGGLLLALWPTPVERLAGGLRVSASRTTVRVAGAVLATITLLTALLLGPW